MTEKCYLCGQLIDSIKLTRDHAVPRTLITRSQPIAKGFDFGGFLPSHADCNNRFGPETYVMRAIELLCALDDENCVTKASHTADPGVVMLALNAACFPSFNAKDMQFFKMIDLRNTPDQEWHDPQFFANKQRTNPLRDARNVASAVLAKSASALLVKRLHSIPVHWRILLALYTGASDELDFDVLFGSTKAFDENLKTWIGQFDTGDWLVVYKAHGLLAIFVFLFSDLEGVVTKKLKDSYGDTQLLRFEGKNLNELLDTGKWADVS